MSEVGTLSLDLSGILLDELASGNVHEPVAAGVADLNFIDANRRNVDRSLRHRRVQLTLNTGPEAGKIELLPGLWEIDAVLASGERIQEEATVRPGEVTEVKLFADGSPRESLEWQHLSGQVAGSRHHFTPLDTRSRQAAIPGLEAAISGRSLNEIADELRDAPGAERSARCRYYRQADSSALWPMLVQALESGPPAEPPGLVLIGEEQWPIRDVYSNFTVPEDGISEGNRYWAIAEGPSGRSLLSLPVPWYGSGGEFRKVGIFIRHVNDGSDLAQASVRDPETAAMLGYLRNDRMSEAAFVSGDYQRWLYTKRQNPVAAAAGGYVLLATQLGSEDAQWMQWIRNLNEWFPTIPDGAVLEGYMCLNGAKSLRDFDRAAKCFQIAFERGLPHYTIGLSWLRSGLRSLEGEFGQLAQPAAIVALASRLAETSQVFSSFRLKQVRSNG